MTKYLSGHSDVVLGAVVTDTDDAGRALHERLRRHRQLHGAIAGPMETWLALRGLRTLSVRLERASANAATLADRLAGHAGVTRVRYPGFGAIVSIEVAGDAEAAERVSAATQVWVHSTSLGGVECQVERRRRQPGEPEAVPDNLLRLSVGIEDVDDLWRDLRSPRRGDRRLSGAGRPQPTASAQPVSALRGRDSSAPTTSWADLPSVIIALTCSTIGTSTPWWRARSRIDVQDFTPSAVCFVTGDDLVDGHPLTEPHAEAVVARQRRHAGGDEVADARRAPRTSRASRRAPSRGGWSRPARG